MCIFENKKQKQNDINFTVHAEQQYIPQGFGTYFPVNKDNRSEKHNKTLSKVLQ